jgi:outer membrane protein OmpA-like peptidoglycan-associated protein
MPDIQKKDTQENYQQLFLVVIFAVSMLALLVTSIMLITPEIEKDLKQKITKQLEKNSIIASVRLSGRDVTLSGIVPPFAIEKVQLLMANIKGIHFIDNQLTSTNPLPLPSSTSQITTPQNILVEKNEATPQREIKSLTSNLLQNNASLTKNVTTHGSSQAYEKILTAMSHYNENKHTSSKNNKSTSKQKLINFDTSNIQFKKNSRSLNSDSKKILTLLAKKLKKSEKKIKITAISKKPELAFKRAKTIQQYLINQGIKKKRLIVVGTTSNTKNFITIMEYKN